MHCYKGIMLSLQLNEWIPKGRPEALLQERHQIQLSSLHGVEAICGERKGGCIGRHEEGVSITEI